MESSDPMLKKKASPAPSSVPMLWKVLAIIFIVISVALLITLIVVATKQQKGAENQDSKPKPTSKTTMSVEPCADGMTSSKEPPKSSSPFNDLTVREITAVRDYLLKQASLNLTEYSKATVDSNYIYLIQLLPPSKEEVLEHLDSNGAKPNEKLLLWFSMVPPIHLW